jgi:hypothetical protein
MCSRDKMSKVLNALGNEYNNEYLIQASKLFFESGRYFEKLCNIFIDYILKMDATLNNTSNIILKIGNLEYEAYQLIKNGIKEL